MNKKQFILAALTGCLLLAAYSLPAAAADDSGYGYVAADLGQAHFSGDVFDAAAPTTGTRSVSDSSTGYRLAAGYQFTPNWGVEAGYVDLGHGTVTLNPVSYRVGAKGFFVAGTGTWPITQQWSLFARAGVISSELDYEARSTGFSQGSHANDTALEATYGLGAKWNVQSQWSLRFGWDRYRNLGNASYNVNLLSLGVEWHFR